jgi:hypothetical protein
MPDTMPLQPGQSFAQGRFVLAQRLGRGGMGEVWRAEDHRLNEQVALKFLPLEIRGDAVALDDLRRETARSHKLTHPNIVRIHDLQEDSDGAAFIVMEYIDGPTLAALRLRQPARVLSWDYLRPLVEQLCAALDYAHGENVIHRDLKPANVMVDNRGRLKLADFGIAAVVSDSMSRVSLRHATSGTLPYMSPQQLSGKRPQVADDIYSLGATLYELLASKPPFYSGDLTHQVLHEPPEPMEERLAAAGIENKIPGDAAALIMACLAKEPELRPRSARAVAEWIGLKAERAPFADDPVSVAQGAPAETRVSARGGFWPKLEVAGMAALVLAGALWLWKGVHGRNYAEAATAPAASTQSAPAMAPAPISSEPSANAPATADWRRGLVLYFSFDEPPKDGVVRDESGRGNDGRVTGASWTPQGRRGGAFAFRPPNNCIRVSNNASLNSAELTAAAWIKTSLADSHWRRILDKDWKSALALSICGDYEQWKPPGKNRGRATFERANAWVAGDSPIADGHWHHIAATDDGSALRIFVDGELQRATRPSNLAAKTNESDFGIGGFGRLDNAQPGQWFDGLIDEVMVFNRALTPAEIRQLYESAGPLPAPAKSPSRL